MSARCAKCAAPVEDPARCSNGHAQPLDQPLATPERLAQMIGENLDYDELADKVADRLRRFIPDLVAAVPAEPAGLVDASEISLMLGKKPGWVYRHKDHLGVVRLGNGPRPRLGFNPDLVMARLAAGEDACSRVQGEPPRPLPAAKVPLLPIKDRAA